MVLLRPPPRWGVTGLHHIWTVLCSRLVFPGQFCWDLHSSAEPGFLAWEVRLLEVNPPPVYLALPSLTLCHALNRIFPLPGRLGSEVWKPLWALPLGPVTPSSAPRFSGRSSLLLCMRGHGLAVELMGSEAKWPEFESFSHLFLVRPWAGYLHTLCLSLCTH